MSCRLFRRKERQGPIQRLPCIVPHGYLVTLGPDAEKKLEQFETLLADSDDYRKYVLLSEISKAAVQVKKK